MRWALPTTTRGVGIGAGVGVAVGAASLAAAPSMIGAVVALAVHAHRAVGQVLGVAGEPEPAGLALHGGQGVGPSGQRGRVVQGIALDVEVANG